MKMKEEIENKVFEIEKFLEELESVLPLSLKEYKLNFKIKAIGERYFERIIEAITDLTFIIIKEKKLKQPEYEKQTFDILKDENIISEILATRLKDAKGMRNILAHEYGRIDDELVFESITKEIIRDANEFLDLIKKL